jgi:arylformamidase
MNIIDISWPITAAMTEYKNMRSVTVMPTKTMERDNVRQTTITLTTHTGTHIDAPAHFLPDGKTIDEIPLVSYIGPCSVIDMMHVNEVITYDDIAHLKELKNNIILFKTQNSFCQPTQEFKYNFVSLAREAAQHLVAHNVKAVGIDYLGIERNQPEHDTHKLFMEETIPIIEGLRLAHVQAGNYFLICLPLLLPKLDAAPARAILLQSGI